MVEQSQTSLTEDKQQAFMKAYTPCHDAFVRYCSALAYGKMNTEDLVQDILLSAYERFDKIRKKDKLLHYLIRAARFRSISNWRKSKFKTELLERHSEHLKAQGASPEMTLDIQLLYRVMEQLPEKQREAIILFEINGFSMKEIAQIQQDSETAVKTRISRGRKKLRHKVEEKRKSHWILLLFGIQSSGDLNLASTFNIDTVFDYLRQAPSELSPIEATGLVQSFPAALGSPYAWLQQLPLNSLAVSVSSIGIIAGNIFLLNPQLSNQVNTASFQAQTPNPVIIQELPLISPERIEKLAIDTPRAPIDAQPFATKEAKAADSPQASSLTRVAPSLAIDSAPIVKDVAAPIANTEEMGLTDGCPKPPKFQGDIQAFKRQLLKDLRQDGLISGNTVQISFDNQDHPYVDGRQISSQLADKYLEFFARYNIPPCPYRIIEITNQYIAVGDVTEEGFSGKMNGRADLNEIGSEIRGRLKKGKSGGQSIGRNSSWAKSTLSKPKPNKDAQTEKRPLAPFHSLKVSGVAVVYLVPGNHNYAEVSVSGMPIEDLITEVEKGVLTVTTKGRPQGEKIQVSIPTASLQTIVVDQTGELYTSETFKAEKLTITMQGVGAAWMDVDLSELKVHMLGGDLEISGVTDERDFHFNKSASRGTLINDKLRWRKE